MADANLDILIQIREQLKGLDKTNRGLQKATSEAGRFRQMLKQGFAIGIGNQVVRQLSRLPGIFANAVGAGVRFTAMLEQQTVAFEVLLGSADKAERLLNKLVSFSSATPLSLEELTGAARQLLAFGVPEDKLLTTLQRVGDVSSGVGAGIKEIAELYGKMRVQGRLLAEDINQLTGRGINVITEFANQLGVSEGQIKKLGSEGKLTFSNLERAFENLTREGGQFGGLLEKQSTTLNGLLSTLSDNINQLLADITQDEFNNFKDTVAELIELVRDEEFKQNLRDIAQLVRNIGSAAVYSGLKLKNFFIGFGHFSEVLAERILNGSTVPADELFKRIGEREAGDRTTALPGPLFGRKKKPEPAPVEGGTLPEVVVKSNEFFEAFKEKVAAGSGAVVKLKNELGQTIEVAVSLDTALGDAFGRTLLSGINEFSAGIANVITGAESMRDVMIGVLQVIIAQLVQATLQALIFKVILGGLGFSQGGLVPKVGSAVTDLPKLARGGLLSGPGSGTSDSILARISAGEFIVKAAQAAKHLNVLEAINSDRSVPGFAEGGLVNAGLNGGERPLNIAFFDSRKDANDWADSMPGESKIMEIVKRNRFQIGVSS